MKSEEAKELLVPMFDKGMLPFHLGVISPSYGEACAVCSIDHFSDERVVSELSSTSNSKLELFLSAES
jgi:hypothetical protein